MTPKEFVKTLLPYAKKAEEKTGISAIFTLGQAAIESGWGKAAPGHAYFGIKDDSDHNNGNEQLLQTTEFSKRADLKFPEIISITPVIRNGQKYFRYVVKDYFRKYDSPASCFEDHARFFLTNPRYAKALTVKSDPREFAKAIALAGYATAPDYAALLTSVISTIEKHI